jgi:hypothetical protein
MPVFKHSTGEGGFTQEQLDAAVAAQLLSDKNVVDAKKASILPTVTDLLGVAGTMIPAQAWLTTTSYTSYIHNYFGYFSCEIGGDLEVDSATYPSRLEGLNISLVGIAPQTITIIGDCTGGVTGDPTAPWTLIVYGAGIGGSTTILASNTGLGALELSGADERSGTLTIDISHNPLQNTEESPAVESLLASIVEINLDTVMDIHGITTPLGAACWQYILQHVSTHADSSFTTDPQSITVSGSSSVTAGVDGTYAWNTAADKFVHATDADLTISYASSKYKIFDEAVEKFRCAYLLSAYAWKFPNNTTAVVTTVFA